MANNAASIDQFPYYDPLIKGTDLKISEVWMAQMSYFVDTLNGYLTQYGMIVPRLNQTAINSIQSPIVGQLVYNTTVDALQVYQVKAGTPAWRSITTTP